LCLMQEFPLVGFDEVIVQLRIGQHTCSSFLFLSHFRQHCAALLFSRAVHPPLVLF
jgi:hypothetical protein